MTHIASLLERQHLQGQPPAWWLTFTSVSFLFPYVPAFRNVDHGNF